METVAKEMVAIDTVANQTVANKTVAMETAANKTVAKKTVAMDTVADKTVSMDTVANKTVAMETVANKTVSMETVANKTDAMGTEANNTVAMDTAAKVTVSMDTEAKVTVPFFAESKQTAETMETVETVTKETVAFFSSKLENEEETAGEALEFDTDDDRIQMPPLLQYMKERLGLEDEGARLQREEAEEMDAAARNASSQRGQDTGDGVKFNFEGDESKFEDLVRNLVDVDGAEAAEKEEVTSINFTQPELLTVSTLEQQNLDDFEFNEDGSLILDAEDEEKLRQVIMINTGTRKLVAPPRRPKKASLPGAENAGSLSAAAATLGGFGLVESGSLDVLVRTFLIIIITNMLMPVQQNIFTHLRVLLVLTDHGISARSN
jgi:hypothetical protein